MVTFNNDKVTFNNGPVTFNNDPVTFNNDPVTFNNDIDNDRPGRDEDRKCKISLYVIFFRDTIPLNAIRVFSSKNTFLQKNVFFSLL